MKILSLYPGCYKVRSALAEFFQSLDKGRMWWYNILGDNEGSVSDILRLDTITLLYVLITDNIVAPERENPEPNLTVNRTEWRKFIDCFGLSVEADPSRVGKNNVDFVHILCIPIPSSIKIHIARHHMNKEFYLQPRKLCLYQLTKNIAIGIVPHIPSALRDLQLGKIFLK